MVYLELSYLFDLDLALRPRGVINPFPDIPKLYFDSEDVIIICPDYQISTICPR